MDKTLMGRQWVQMQHKMETEGVDAVIAHTSGLDPQAQMEIDSMACKRFYADDWQGKSLDRYAEYVERLIEKYLKLAGSDQEQADKYRDFANSLSYNLSANLAECWPDEEIQKEHRHFELGLKVAERCVQLREQLKKDDISMSRAHWLVGAQHLALKQWEQAAEAFGTAYQYASGRLDASAPVTANEGDSPDQLLNAGYLAVARLAAGKPEAEALYDQVMYALLRMGADLTKTEDAAYFRDQIEYVRELYA